MSDLAARTRRSIPLAAGISLALALGACTVTPGASEAMQMDQGERYARALELIEDAQRHADRGRVGEAIEAYKRSIEMTSSIAAAWNNMGELLMTQNQYSDAVTAFERAGDLSPTDPRPPYNAGVVYQNQGWARDALERFELSLDRDPNYLPALRGAVRAAEYLQLANTATLDRIKRATLSEGDEAWREYFQRQRFRVEAGLDAD
ncbi:MAG: tetratricopeptide repeat protein [Phycisphaerales bacterium]